jgi:hypothetical protein
MTVKVHAASPLDRLQNIYQDKIQLTSSALSLNQDVERLFVLSSAAFQQPQRHLKQVRSGAYKPPWTFSIADGGR